MNNNRSSGKHMNKRSSINPSASFKHQGLKSLDSLEDNIGVEFHEIKQSNFSDNSNDVRDNKTNGYEELDRLQDKNYIESINCPLLGEGDDDLNNNGISTTRHYSDKLSTEIKSSHHYRQVDEGATRFTLSDNLSKDNDNNDNQDDSSVTRRKRQQLNNSDENREVNGSTTVGHILFNTDYEDGTDNPSHKKEDSADHNQYDKNNDNNDMSSINNLNIIHNESDTRQLKDSLQSYNSSENRKLSEGSGKSGLVRLRRKNKTSQEQEGLFYDKNSDLNIEDKFKGSNRTENFANFTESNNWRDKYRNTLPCKSASDEHFPKCRESWSTLERSILFIKEHLSSSASKCNMQINNNRYQTFAQSNDEESVQESQSGLNELQRPVNLIRKYSKLNHHYIRPTKEYTFIPELKRLLLLLLIVVVSCVILWKIYEVQVEEYNYLGVVESPSKLGTFKHYAVSTDALPCAKVGKALLAKGGSAVDAAVGTLLCMGVVIPNSLGLGGGCLMTVYDRKEGAIVIDGREVAPDYASENMFANDSLKASRGPLSIGIPGELAAYWIAHQKFGKLKWSELFEGSINLAENGTPLVEHLAFALRAKNHAKYITEPLAKLMTNNATGQYYDKGEIFIQKELATTLKRIRDNGVQEFYGGLTGQLFIEDLKKQGGSITLENLKNYEALVKPALSFNLAPDLTMFSQPPPGSGIVLSIILRVMKELGYYKNLKPQLSFESSSLYYHRLIEAFKFAYAQRAGLEDKPDDSDRMIQLMEKLSSDQFILEVAAKITNETHASDYYGGLEYFNYDHGTAHVSVIDAQGNAAAVTSSINLYFGSGLLSPSTGILYNDVMDDFTSPNIVNKFNLAPSKLNRIRPGKRPLSSMAPSVFTDSEGNVKLVIGGSGGSKITTAIASVSLRNCFLGEDIKTAIDGPRLHHQFLPDKVMFEHYFPKELFNSLVDRNHSLEEILDRSSVIMAVANDQKGGEKRLTANSDYRKGGSVDGE